jgi:hypothetical protein
MPRKSLILLSVFVLTFAVGTLVAPQPADALPRFFCSPILDGITDVATGTGTSCAEATSNLYGQLAAMDDCQYGTCNTNLVITQPCSCGCCQWTVKGYLEYHCLISLDP